MKKLKVYIKLGRWTWQRNCLFLSVKVTWMTVGHGALKYGIPAVVIATKRFAMHEMIRDSPLRRQRDIPIDLRRSIILLSLTSAPALGRVKINPTSFNEARAIQWYLARHDYSVHLSQSNGLRWLTQGTTDRPIVSPFLGLNVPPLVFISNADPSAFKLAT